MDRNNAFLIACCIVGALVLGGLVALFAFGGSDSKVPAQEARATTSRPSTQLVSIEVDAVVEQQLLWPAIGPIKTYFEPNNPAGMEISLDSASDLSIRASAAGRVTFAGGQTCCGDGLYVVVSHADGMTSLYAHLATLNVTENQEVGQGQVLGTAGSTGTVIGRTLRYELRREGTAVDPLRYLSAQPTSNAAVSSAVSCPSEAIDVSPASWVNLTFKPESSTGTALSLRDVSVSSIGSSFEFTALGTPQVNGLNVVLNVPRASSANGQLSRFKLAARLSDGTNEQTVECELRVTTMPSLNNPDPTPEPTDVPLVEAAPTNQGTVTVTAPAPPASSTTAPTRTPTPAATNTPANTPTTGPPKGLTPQPPKGLTPQAPGGRSTPTN